MDEWKIGPLKNAVLENVSRVGSDEVNCAGTEVVRIAVGGVKIIERIIREQDFGRSVVPDATRSRRGTLGYMYSRRSGRFGLSSALHGFLPFGRAVHGWVSVAPPRSFSSRSLVASFETMSSQT